MLENVVSRALLITNYTVQITCSSLLPVCFTNAILHRKNNLEQFHYKTSLKGNSCPGTGKAELPYIPYATLG